MCACVCSYILVERGAKWGLLLFLLSLSSVPPPEDHPPCTSPGGLLTYLASSTLTSHSRTTKRKAGLKSNS